MWDEKYSTDEYMYGEEPNDFLRNSVASIPKGRILFIGDGEGRNGVWLARQGYEVVSLDGSQIGLDKAHKLAEKHGVSIETIHANLKVYDFGEAQWDGVVSIWCHLPEEVRKRVHQMLPASLKKGGVYLLEAYTPQQVGRGTGGPPVKELMVTLEGLKDEVSELTIEVGEEVEREIHEGRGHNGMSSTVQYLGRKI